MGKNDTSIIWWSWGKLLKFEKTLKLVRNKRADDGNRGVAREYGANFEAVAFVVLSKRHKFISVLKE